MAKLSKLHRNQIARALYEIKRAHTYIMQPRIEVARAEAQATTTLHYVRAYDGAALYPVKKEYGSDLCGMEDAMRVLSDLLAS